MSFSVCEGNLRVPIQYLLSKPEVSVHDWLALSMSLHMPGILLNQYSQLRERLSPT